MQIQVADLKTTVFRMGNYTGPGGPSLRTMAGVSFNDQENTHFACHNGNLSYKIDNHPAGGKRINFIPSTGHQNCYYLPYRDNNITSIRIGTGGNRFFTDNLSGCSIFIDRISNSDLILYHANRQGADYKPSAAQASDVTFEREVAIAVKKQMHSDARTAAYAGATPSGSLFKKSYNAGARNFNNISKWSGSNERFGGGTTVVGFRSGTGWEFWYQTWNGGPSPQVVGFARFYP